MEKSKILGVKIMEKGKILGLKTLQEVPEQRQREAGQGQLCEGHIWQEQLEQPRCGGAAFGGPSVRTWLVAPNNSTFNTWKSSYPHP